MDDAGADGPQPTFQVGYLSLIDGARLCALASRCPQLSPSINASIAVPLDTLNFSSCLDWASGPLPSTHVGIALQAAELACAAQATTCEKAGACLSQEKLALDDPRCPVKDAGNNPGSLETCDPNGDVIRCDVPDILHCSSGFYAPQSKCMQGDDGRSWCALDRNCVSASCIGNLLDYCANSLHESVNCAAVGFTCGLDSTPGGYTDCLTGDRVKECTQTGTACDGTVIAVCDGFHRSEFDCQALGGTCSKTGSNAHCARPNDECTPFDTTVNTCAGSTISLCVGGKKASLDCAATGLQCLPGSGAQSGRCG